MSYRAQPRLRKLKALCSKLKPQGSNLKAHVALCLTVALVAWMAAGCGGGGVAGDARLLAVDSIVDTDSVAAWRQLQAIDSASLATDADRHLYALLHQQILYKQYLPLDTVVLSELCDYYAAHPDGNRLTRALLLSGGACEDMGLLAEAMTWYKRAEAEADTADYRSLAQANLRQGFLYYRNYADHHIIKQKLENAAHYYEQLGDSAYLAITLECLGAVYRTVNHGQAHTTLERAARLALSAGNEPTYVASNEKLARCLLTDSLPVKRLKSLRNVSVTTLSNILPTIVATRPRSRFRCSVVPTRRWPICAGPRHRQAPIPG